MDRVITAICLTIAIVCLFRLDTHCKVSYNVALLFSSIVYMILAIINCRGVIIC